MRLKILVSIAGLGNPKRGMSDFAYAPGETVTVTKNVAEAWIANGIAEAAEPALEIAPKPKKK